MTRQEPDVKKTIWAEPQFLLGCGLLCLSILNRVIHFRLPEFSILALALSIIGFLADVGASPFTWGAILCFFLRKDKKLGWITAAIFLLPILVAFILLRS